MGRTSRSRWNKRPARRTIPAAMIRSSEATRQANGQPWCETRRPNSAGLDFPIDGSPGLHCP